MRTRLQNDSYKTVPTVTVIARLCFEPANVKPTADVLSNTVKQTAPNTSVSSAVTWYILATDANVGATIRLMRAILRQLLRFTPSPTAETVEISRVSGVSVAGDFTGTGRGVRTICADFFRPVEDNSRTCSADKGADIAGDNSGNARRTRFSIACGLMPILSASCLAVIVCIMSPILSGFISVCDL